MAPEQAEVAPPAPPAPPRPAGSLDRISSWADRLPFEHPVLAALVMLTVGAVALWAFVRPEPVPVELSLPRADPDAQQGSDAMGPTTATSEVTVHAAGAVVRPGLYRLAPGSRVADLLEAAGGPAADADLDQLNLAAPLGDGERVLVPRVGEVAAVSETPSGAGTLGAKVDLNRASAAELDELPGIGPATAEAIIRHREQHGRFRSVSELLEVRGIGEAKLSKLRPLVRV